MESAINLRNLTIPVVNSYKDYRAFMRDSYQFKRTTRAGFSFRRFSQMAGLKSPNFLQMVMTGKRNLSTDLAPAVARVLCKTAAEQSYFVALVKIANAQTPVEQEEANLQMMVAVRRILTKEVPREKEAILAHWYFMAIRELVFLPGFKPSGEWIAKKLRGLITPEEADEGLRTLIKCGFLKKENGRYEPVDPIIDTGDEMAAHRLLQGHLSIFHTWAKILPKLPSSDRELGILNIPIAKNKIPEFKERIRRFQDEIIGWLCSEENPELIVQLGTYLVPVTIEGDGE